MATLNVFSDQDTSRTITTMAELQSAVPVDPHIPSIYALDFDDQTVQVVFGDPDRQHHTVKYFTGYGSEKQIFGSIEQARVVFLKLAQSAL